MHYGIHGNDMNNLFTEEHLEDQKKSIPFSTNDERARLCPRRLDDFYGQEEVTRILQVSIQAAKKLNEPLDHVLLIGPTGVGKRTLAGIIANEMGSSFQMIPGSELIQPGEVVNFLTNLQDNDIWFIDDIHCISPHALEVLCDSMEDFAVDIVLGKSPQASKISLDLPRFTIVGATSERDSVPPVLREKFGFNLTLAAPNKEEQYYTNLKIINRNAGLMGISINETSAQMLAKVCRNPRLANTLLRRARDFAIVVGDGTVTNEIAEKAISILGL